MVLLDCLWCVFVFCCLCLRGLACVFCCDVGLRCLSVCVLTFVWFVCLGWMCCVGILVVFCLVFRFVFVFSFGVLGVWLVWFVCSVCILVVTCLAFCCLPALACFLWG